MTETDYLHFTVTGQIEETESGLSLVTTEGTRLKIKKCLPEIQTQLTTWQVIPSTDSDGIISSILLEKECLDQQKEECSLRGRVTQIGAKGKGLQLKISRPGLKTLRINLNGVDKRMKVGEDWEIIANRVENRLLLQKASPQSLMTEEKLSLAISKEITILPSVSSTSESDNKIASRVQEVLKTETQVEDWQLKTVKKRSLSSWECVAYSPSIDRRARVNLNGKAPEVYCFGEASDLELPVLSNPDRLIVTPLGAARGIGASCFQILIGPYEIVLDCGTRPKGYDPLPALDLLNNPNLLLISHAHQDHLGAVPVFHNRYPGVRMITTEATRELAYVMLTDGLKIQQRSEDSPQLFDSQDLESTLFRLETQPVGTDFEPLPGLVVRFINAGHILGAACIYLRYGERSLLYTGDFHTTNSRTTTGLSLKELPTAEILITESTYGDGLHPSRKTQEGALIESLVEVVKAGGNVLIPAFALGRAQEILLALRTASAFQKLSVPIYVDGLVRAVTEVFRENLNWLPTTVQNLIRINGQEPFFDPEGTPPIIPIENSSQRPLAIAQPSIIVASSGMLTGGASVYYAGVLLERENAAIFLSGYTDEESPGRLLQNLQTGDTIELDGKSITVRAQVKRFNLSAHADKVGLGQVINRVNPKHLILIHGSIGALHELASSGDNQVKFYIHIPKVGEAISLGSFPEHLSDEQLTKIAQPQEFEMVVEKIEDETMLQVPNSVVEKDPRWQMFSKGEIVDAIWDGLCIKLIPRLNSDFVDESNSEIFDEPEH
ncbi:MAG: MBL fold metallo-hydrolase [Hydrococcus sp. RM1_1_31]|nr:MBL fold metallo-hydrolase [Hydrococcus sp. RM1_1_31]